MEIKIKRFDTKIPLPKYEKEAAGFDFYCRTSISVKPNEIVAIPGNIAVVIPHGYLMFIVPRSSTPTRRGLIMPHSVGVIDPFFCGNDNEVKLIFQNITNKAVRIIRGDKLAQGIFVKYETAIFNEVKKLRESKRKNCGYKR